MAIGYAPPNPQIVSASGSLGLLAGEAHIGEVSGPTVYLPSTPTLTVAGAYATGNYVGPSASPASFAGVARIAGAKSLIQSLTIIDKQTAAAVNMELWLFSQTITVPTDKAAWAISDADALFCVGVIPITTDKWYASGNNKVYSDGSLGRVVQCSGTSLFYALVARGTTPTWASGDLQLSLGVLQ